MNKLTVNSDARCFICFHDRLHSALTPGSPHKDGEHVVQYVQGELGAQLNLLCSGRYWARDGREPNEFVILDLALDLQLCLLRGNLQSLFVQVLFLFFSPAPLCN